MERLKLHNGLSWRRSLPDFRDYAYGAKFIKETPEKIDSMSSIDLSSSDIPIWDQGDFGACTIFGSAFMQIFAEMKSGMAYRTPAWMQVYWNMRALDKSGASVDSGGTGRDALKSLLYWGSADDSVWPYDEKHFALDPTPDVVTAAESHKVKSYYAVNQTLTEIMHCLQSGFPVGFGFMVYESFMQTTGDTGVCELPESGEQDEGGHYVSIVGLDMSTKMVKVRNSWSATWGKDGYFSMPFQYLLDPNLCSDFWTLRTTE
jgi:C1A family cysteine protease